MDLQSQKIALDHCWQAHQPSPHTGRARIVLFSSGQPATHLADPVRRLSGTGSSVCYVARGSGAQHTPCFFTQDLVTRGVRPLPTHQGQPINPPGHHKINSQARLQTVRIVQAAILDAASALDRAMIHFDTPASAIPAQPLTGILKALRLNRGQKHPIDGLCHLGPIAYFPGIDRPYAQRLKLAGSRWAEHHLSKTYLEPGGARWTRTSTRDCYIKQSRHRLRIHSLPQILLLDLSVACTFSTDQKPRSTPMLRGFVEQFVEVGFAVPNAYKHGIRTKLLCLGYSPVTHQPLDALLFFDRQLVAAVLFAGLAGSRAQHCTLSNPSGVPWGVNAIVS